MAVLKMLDSTALDFFKDKRFIEENIGKFQNYSDNAWLIEAYGKTPFIETKYEIKDFSFDMSAASGHESTTEFENVKEVYTKLRFLSDSNASEEKLWAGLSLSYGYEYVQYRWHDQLKNASGILDHFFFNAGNRRAYTRNAMARLWWIGRLTYDEQNLSDPWHLTRFVCEGSDYVFHFLERTTSNNIEILRPFLTAMLEARQSGIEINTDDAGELSKELNILGASYALDFMPEEWIKEKMRSVILEYSKQKSILQGGPAENEYLQKGEVRKENQTDEKIRKSDSVLLRRRVDSKVIRVNASGNGFRMKPSSLVGMKTGDSVKIGKMFYEIIGVN